MSRCKALSVNDGLYCNPFGSLVLGAHLKVIHTQTNLQLKIVGLFKNVWPFSGHQLLKGWRLMLEYHMQIT